MTVKILIDNRQDAEGVFFSEHGLSLYFEACGKRFLVDTGLSGKAIDNALAMGVDVGKADYLILSHGHRDHTGGLWRFMEENRDGRIVCSRKVAELAYTSDSGGARHSLDPDRDLIARNMERFVFLDREVFEVRDGWSVVSAGACCMASCPRPRGNRLLLAGGLPYNGEDELVVAVAVDGRCTVISPCSHSGLGNILDCARRRTGLECDTFIGGLHLIDGEGDDCSLDECARVKRLYTGHCTGRMALERLSSLPGVEVFRTGDAICC